MINQLVNKIPDLRFNGNSAQTDLSLSTVLSVSLPDNGIDQSPLTYLDQHHICASGGSACSSRSTTGSHVLSALGGTYGRHTVRFSFSRYNTIEEIDYAAETLGNLYIAEPFMRAVS